MYMQIEYQILLKNVRTLVYRERYIKRVVEIRPMGRLREGQLIEIRSVWLEEKNTGRGFTMNGGGRRERVG